MTTAAQHNSVEPLSADPLKNPEDRRYGFGFLIRAGYEMLGLASALSVLRRANQLCGNERYHWQLISPDGLPVNAANGLEIQVHQAADQIDLDPLDALIACGNESHHNGDHEKALIGCLHRAQNSRLTLGSFGNGSLLLAHAGLLNGYHCAAHWDVIPTLRDLFPQIQAQPSTFEIDRNRFSCSAGSSAMDLMLALVTQQQGNDLGVAISDSLACDRERNISELQQNPQCSRLGDIQPKLSEAITLMEANLEEPMTQTELASHVNISARQLDRIFQKYIGRSPSRYYLELRMTQARQMLIRTENSVIDIAVANGFLSGTHFSRRYREFFGISPREARKQSRNRPLLPSDAVPGLLAAMG